jgi:UDP:flavonoid glycosyltransferase YjiC (YdhE family)
MVLTGAAQDKPQTGGIVEYTGVGLYFRQTSLSPKQIAESVTEVLSNPKYGNNVERIAQQYKERNALDLIDRAVRELIAAPAVTS